jgi:hypothetical protein
MSIEALGHVFLLTLPANEKWLLVCLANHADKWGDSIFPALDTLEEESGMSRSTIKRAFKNLLHLKVIERSAKSTPVSPAFYRIVGVPEPKGPLRSDPQCPNALRRAIIHEFQSCCEYCHRRGTKEFDPDGHAWNVDRVVPGRRGGIYTPDNVTLACRSCNGKKKSKDAPLGTRTLSELQHGRTVQPDLPSADSVELTTVQPEPSVGSNSQEGRVQNQSLGGFRPNPEPLTEPSTDPEEQGPDTQAAPPPASPDPEQDPNDNLRVITKLAHETYGLLGLTADLGEVTETVKSRCAQLKIRYYPGDVVRRAIDSARWQREHRSEAS